MLLCAVRENAWPATVNQEKAGWLPHEALPMILPWQPFVSAARHGNVAFVTGGSYKVRAQCDSRTPEVQIPCDRATEPAPKITGIFIIWPFPFRFDLSPRILMKYNKKQNLIEYVNWNCGSGGLCASYFFTNFPGYCSPVCVSHYLMWLSCPSCSMLLHKMKNNLWKTALTSHATCWEHITAQRNGFINFVHPKKHFLLLVFVIGFT